MTSHFVHTGNPFALTLDEANYLADKFETPLYLYDQEILLAQAKRALSMPNAFGLLVRFAMKALPTRAVLRIFHEAGLHIDASSGYEAERAMAAGIPAGNIQLTAQELPRNLKELIGSGVLFNATSLHQLKTFGELFPGHEVSIRVNPGLGSGHSNRTNVGGPSSSFGIWRDYIKDGVVIANQHKLKLTSIHSHVGAGTDPKTWEHCAKLTLEFASSISTIERVSLGGGFKVARMSDESSADLTATGVRIKPLFEGIFSSLGRKLKLEIEPGTFLTAHAGALLTRIIDIVDTGPEGYRFLKVDAGMTEILRPGIYGAQHPIDVIPRGASKTATAEYLVVGHCCESGDIITPAPGDPEGLKTRTMNTPDIGDYLLIGCTGAYCSGFSTVNYNSFPKAGEVLRASDGKWREIRKRETLQQILENERIS